jgi:hypothetical protein
MEATAPSEDRPVEWAFKPTTTKKHQGSIHLFDSTIPFQSIHPSRTSKSSQKSFCGTRNHAITELKPNLHADPEECKNSIPPIQIQLGDIDCYPIITRSCPQWYSRTSTMQFLSHKHMVLCTFALQAHGWSVLTRGLHGLHAGPANNTIVKAAMCSGSGAHQGYWSDPMLAGSDVPFIPFSSHWSWSQVFLTTACLSCCFDTRRNRKLSKISK